MPSLLTKIDGIYDRAAFVIMPPNERKQYLSQLKKLANNKFSLLLITMNYDNTHDGPPYQCTTKEIEALFGSAYQIEKLGESNDTLLCHRLTAKNFINIHEQVYHVRATIKAR